MACKLNRAIAFDCSSIPQGGIEPYVIAINFEDYRAAKLAADVIVDGTSKEITSILLPNTLMGYKFSVPKGSNIMATSPLRQVDGIDGFDHSVVVRAATITKLDLDEVSKMRFNKVVLIVPLSEGRAKVYGGNVGLRLLTYDVSDGDAGTSGTVSFTAQTDSREAPESQIPDLVAKAFDLTSLLVASVNT